VREEAETLVEQRGVKVLAASFRSSSNRGRRMEKRYGSTLLVTPGRLVDPVRPFQQGTR